jgi:long-subunit acyl-CoA synthetase (AMP-forming)
VIEAYGMTEAAHQMASNPLPPRAQKPGSVGIAAGPRGRDHGRGRRLLRSAQTGEVVIRGPNVTPGYENNPEANAKSFFEAERLVPHRRPGRASTRRATCTSPAA